MIQTDSSSTIVREITINAPASVVFAALTEPDQITTWWGTDTTYRTTGMERDLRVGGTWKTVGASAAGESFSVGGVYRAIDAPYRLEFTWRHDWGPRTDAAETIVRYDLDEHDGITQLRVTHWGFDNLSDRDDHGRGWIAVLDLLRAHLEKHPAAQ